MRDAAYEIARQSDDFAPSIAHQIASAVTASFNDLAGAWKIAKLRRTLNALDDMQLADIGVARGDIDAMTGGTETPAATIARLRGESRRYGWSCYAG